MKQPEEDTNLFRNLITSPELKFLIALLIACFGFIKLYFGPIQDIALIQKDIATINSTLQDHNQYFQEQLDALAKRQSTDEKTTAGLQSQIVTILGK